MQFVAVAGTRGLKATLIAHMRSGTTLVLNDIVGNIRDASRFSGWLLHIVGFAGKEARIPKVMKAGVIKDTNALRAQLLQWSEIESLKRILASHGAPIEDNPRQTLRDLAESLGHGAQKRAA